MNNITNIAIALARRETNSLSVLAVCFKEVNFSSSTNNAKGQQREITLKLGLQSTEAYFPYIAYVFFVFYCVRLKIHAANIEALKFGVFFENYS